MKIIAVGMNYALHNQELGHTQSREPVIFMKPDSALLKDGKPFFLPDFSDEIQYEAEVVVRICRLGKHIAPRFARRYYDAATVGIDFTARDVQRRCMAEGLPWEICKAFDHSAALSPQFISLSELGGDVQNLHFEMSLNDQIRQQGDTAQMIFSVNRIVSYLSQFFTLKMGDLIFTGTPVGVGPVKPGDHIRASLEGHTLLDFDIK